VEEGLLPVPLQNGRFLLDDEGFNSNGVASLGKCNRVGQFDDVS